MKHCFTDAGRNQYEPKEKRDCTVRALAIATGISYRQAHTTLKVHGRKNGKGVYMDRIMKKIRVINSLTVTPIGDTGITVREYVKLHCQTGRFLILIRQHAFAVVDGIIHDMANPKPRSIVLGAYRFDALHSSCLVP